MDRQRGELRRLADRSAYDQWGYDPGFLRSFPWYSCDLGLRTAVAILLRSGGRYVDRVASHVLGGPAANKKAAVPISRRLRLVASKLCKRTCGRLLSENVPLCDVGSLAVSAASGHKSRVVIILADRTGIYKQARRPDKSFFPRSCRSLRSRRLARVVPRGPSCGGPGCGHGVG